MEYAVTHSRTEESIEAKTRWFRSLTLEERMDLLCEFTNLLLSANPEIVEQKMLNLLGDVFSSLQKHKVRYLVIGGIAAVLHGVPRATFDRRFLSANNNSSKIVSAAVVL